MIPERLGSFKFHKEVTQYETQRKNKQAVFYNRRHRAKKLSSLSINESVWIIHMRVYGKVVKTLDIPNSYWIKTENGSLVKRNRWHLIPAPYSGLNADGQLPDLPVEENNELYKKKDNDREENVEVEEQQKQIARESPQARPQRNRRQTKFYGNLVKH